MSLMRLFGPAEARSARRASLASRPRVDALDGRLLLSADLSPVFASVPSPVPIVGEVASPSPSDGPETPVNAMGGDHCVVQKVRLS